jgi:hypothetical protein
LILLDWDRITFRITNRTTKVPAGINYKG